MQSIIMRKRNVTDNYNVLIAYFGACKTLDEPPVCALVMMVFRPARCEWVWMQVYL